jgi:hypothetical protein
VKGPRKPERALSRYWTDPQFRERTLANIKTNREQKKDTPEWQVRQMFMNARRRAIRDGLKFDITKDDITIPARCPILDVPFGPTNTPFTPTLDRVNNDRGYVKGNVAVVTKIANSMKGKFTLQDVERLLAYMRTAA